MTRVVSTTIAALFVILTGTCASGAILEELNLFQGNPLQNLSGITFDGKLFSIPGGKQLPRGEVQSLEFQNREPGKQNQPASDSATGLTPATQQNIEKGKALAQQNPGVSGVILIDDGEFDYRPDGTNVYQYHFAGLVLKEDAKDWAQVVLNFTEGRSQTRLLYAHALGPDGILNTLSPQDMKISSPSEELSFFNPTRKIVTGVIPGVEIGSIVEYAYEFEEYNPEDPRLFSPGFFFQGREPVVTSRLTVRAPQNVHLNYTTRNFADKGVAEPKIEEKNTTKTYVWTLENVPPIIPEAMMPPEPDVAPRVECSIFKNDAEVYGLLRTLQETRIRVTPEIQAKVDELTKDAQSLDEKMARIYHWVQANTRYVSIKGSLGAGFSGHTAQETFENRYGDCTDKSILFCTMLKAIGVDAYPIILMTNDAGVAITGIPTLSGNHCITEVSAAGRDFFLDSTSEDYRYPYFRDDDHGAYACNAMRGETTLIPVPAPEQNSRHSKLEMDLDPSGDLHVKTRNQYTGSIEAGVRGFWKQVRKDNYPLMMSEYVNSISPGANLENFTLSDLNDLSVPLEMTLDYTLRNHAIRAKKLLYMRIPTLEREFQEAALETRKYPIQYFTTEERVLEVDLTLPKGTTSRWLPEPLDIKNAYLEYHAGYVEQNGHVIFHETFRRLQRIVPVADYPAYRDALQSISSFTKQEIFLTEKG